MQAPPTYEEGSRTMNIDIAEHEQEGSTIVIRFVECKSFGFVEGGLSQAHNKDYVAL